MSILTSGIWSSSVSDPYLLAQPVVSGVSTNNAGGINRDSWDHANFFTLNVDTAVMASPSDPDLTYFYYKNTTTGETRELDFGGNAIFYQFSLMPVPWDKQLLETNGEFTPWRSLYNEELDTGRNSSKYYISPIAIGGGTEIGLYWEQQIDDSSYNVPDLTEHTIEARTPYMWNRVDIAQLIWSWSKFHSADGLSTNAEDYLNEDSFLAYSSNNDNNLMVTVLLDVWREIGKKQSEQILDLIKQSGAWVAFMGSGADPLEHKMRLVVPGVPDTTTNTIDFDSLMPTSVVSYPTMRYNDSLLINTINATWGSFLEMDVPANDVADNHSTVSLIEGTSIADNANVITDTYEQSTIERGTLEANLTLKNIPEEDFASARISINLERWGEQVRELVFDIGPLHLDFNTGDLIKISLEEYGLSDTEFLVTKKSIRLFPLPGATVTAVEWKSVGTATRMSPDDTSLDYAKTFWYTTSSGLTPAIDGTRIDTWEDASQRISDYAGSSQAVISGVGPIYTASNSAINNYPSVQFNAVTGSGCALLLDPDFADDPSGALVKIETSVSMIHDYGVDIDSWIISPQTGVTLRDIFDVTKIEANYNSGTPFVYVTFTNTAARDRFYDNVDRWYFAGEEFTGIGTKSGNDLRWTSGISWDSADFTLNIFVDQSFGWPAAVQSIAIWHDADDYLSLPFDHTCIAVIKPPTGGTQALYHVHAFWGDQQDTTMRYGMRSTGSGAYTVATREDPATEEAVTADWQVVTYVQRRGTFDRGDLNNTYFYKGVLRMPGNGADEAKYFNNPSYDVRSGARVRHLIPSDGLPTIGADNVSHTFNQYTGEMADILFFRNSLKPHEIKKIVRYLGNKYNIDVEV